MEKFRPEGSEFLVNKKEIREYTDDEVLEAAYQKALETETDKIRVEDFVELYGEEKVAKDKSFVRGLRKEFDEQDSKEQSSIDARKFGKILEAILIEQIELNEWFGPSVDTQQTTDFDDYCNGIDFLSTFKKDGMQNFLGFAIDATHGVTVIRRKMEKIRRELDNGQLGSVRYFQSSDSRIRGSQKDIPKIVLALDKKHVLELSKLWIQGKQKVLSQHSARHMIVQEIFIQLRAQQAYVRGSISHGAKGLDRLDEMLTSQILFLEKFIPESHRIPVSRSEDDGLDMIHETCDVMFIKRKSPSQAKTKKEKVAKREYLLQIEELKIRKQEDASRLKYMRGLEKRSRAGDLDAKRELREYNDAKRKANEDKKLAA